MVDTKRVRYTHYICEFARVRNSARLKCDHWTNCCVYYDQLQSKWKEQGWWSFIFHSLAERNEYQGLCWLRCAVSIACQRLQLAMKSNTHWLSLDCVKNKCSAVLIWTVSDNTSWPLSCSPSCMMPFCLLYPSTATLCLRTMNVNCV